MIFDIRRASDVDLLRKGLAGLRVGLTSGSYDLYHNMHGEYLKRCSRLCDCLIVGVDSDDLVRERKGSERPIIPEHERVAIIDSLRYVTATFILGTVQDFELATRSLGVQVIFKNDNFAPEEVLGRDLAEVVIIPDLVELGSTSRIIGEIVTRRTKHNGE